MTDFSQGQVSAGEVLAPLEGEIESLHERWAGKTLTDVHYEMPLTQHIEVDESSSVEAVVLDPADRDGTSIVLSLPYMNGWTPHHYIRARTMQELVSPNSRVVVLPAEPDSVTLNEKDRNWLAMSGGVVLAEKQMKALEGLDLGATALSGYSWGGTTSVNLALLGSDRLEVTGLNVDEIPSETDRDTSKLKGDFMKSGGPLALRAAIKEAGIPALTQAMSVPRMALDLARFGIRSLSSDSKLLADAMSQTAEDRIAGAVRQVGPERSKVGYIEGSRIFDPSSNTKIARVNEGARIVRYGGEGFHGHASADNVVLHAGMVYHGLHH